MRTRLRLTVTIAVVAAVLAGAMPAAASAARSVPPTPGAGQIGTYAYLTTPDYDALAPISDVLAGPSTIGLGTFAALDGELVIVGGVPYRVGLDGTPRPVASTTMAPFVEAIAFRPSRSIPVAPGTSCAALDDVVASAAGAAADGFVAVRVRGTFTSLVTRSVPEQTKPYPTLAEVVATQTQFDLGRRRAVLVGFRTGPAATGLGAPGLHLHGLTADRAAGGHVLSCVAGSDVELSIEPVPAVRVVMPTPQ